VFGAQVMMVKLQIVSPLAGSFQHSHSPAKAKGASSAMAKR
jgi:hypothetical protein